MSQVSSIDWWRPEPRVVATAPASGIAEDTSQGRLAFRALLAFTFVLFFAPQAWLPALAPLRLALVAAVAAIAGYVMDRIRQPTALATPPEFVIAASLLGWALFTVPLSLWPGGSVSVILDLYLKSLIVFWLLGRVVSTPGRLYRLAWTLSLLSVPVALSGLLNYVSGAVIGNDRIRGYASGIAMNPNDLALTLDIILPFTLAVLVGAKTAWARLAAGGIAVLSIAAVIVTFSRGGFLALAVIGVLGLVWLLRWKPMIALGALLAALLVAPPLLPAGYIARLATTLNIDSDPTHSAQERWRDMQAAVEVVQENPIAGVGVGQNLLALNELRGDTWRKVHDVYLEYAADLGLVGLGLFLLLLGSSVRTARRAERAARGRNDRLAALAGGVRISLMAFALAGFFYPVAYYFYFYYLAGLAVSLRTITGSAKS